MSVLPPFFDAPAPPGVCSRWFGDHHCGKPAAWHVIWTSDVENGLCCEEHMAEAQVRWAYYAAHRYRRQCSMPGAQFVESENRCVAPGEPRGRGPLEADEESPREGTLAGVGAGSGPDHPEAS